MPPSLVEKALQLGLKYHADGRLQEAESVYRQALAAEPEYPEACTR